MRQYVTFEGKGSKIEFTFLTEGLKLKKSQDFLWFSTVLWNAPENLGQSSELPLQGIGRRRGGEGDVAEAGQEQQERHHADDSHDACTVDSDGVIGLRPGPVTSSICGGRGCAVKLGGLMSGDLTDLFQLAPMAKLCHFLTSQTYVVVDGLF